MAKDERRRRITEAASLLLRDIGADTLSVKMVADHAGVSPATVYNLFGSRLGVLEQVYALGLNQFDRMMAAAPSHDALERVFDSVTMSAANYRAEPRLHLGLILRGDGGRDRHMALAMHRIRSAFWQEVLSQAVAEGLLAPDTDTERVCVLMVQAAAGGLTHWAADLISIEELEQQLLYSLAAVLWPFTTPAARCRLEARMHAATLGLERLATAGRTADRPAPQGAAGAHA